MRLLFIICEASVEERIEGILDRCAAPGYTRFTGCTGHGKHGPREGTPVWPGLNSLIMACMAEESVPDVLEGIERLEAERGNRLAVKVFAVPAQEYC